MRVKGAWPPRVSWLSHATFKSIAGIGARAAAVGLLVAGIAESLAARRHRSSVELGKDGHDKSKKDRADNDRNPEARENREQLGSKDDKQKADGQSHKDERQVEREQRDHGDRRTDRHRDRDQKEETDHSSKARSDNQEQRATHTEKQANTNTDGGAEGDGPNRAGNAGSGFFDSPLATKARRRANDFEGRNRDEDDGIVVDVNPEGESIYQTDNISYSTGPDGVEIVTKNITYTAAPTPTPTPLPTLELPDRESSVFDSVSVTPPSQPPADDTSGGNNTGDFVS